jgi:hypothetical protein
LSLADLRQGKKKGLGTLLYNIVFLPTTLVYLPTQDLKEHLLF